MADFSKLMEKKAAALKYDSEKNGAPMIVAAGMGYMAEKITETAMKAGVPIYEDDSIASLLTQMKLGEEIPEELFQAIVEIYIYFLGFTGEKEDEGSQTVYSKMSQASPVAVAKNKKAGAYRAMLFFHGFFSERGVGGIGSH